MSSFANADGTDIHSSLKDYSAPKSPYKEYYTIIRLQKLEYQQDHKQATTESDFYSLRGKAKKRPKVRIFTSLFEIVQA